jgi:hypothetical protein
MNQCDLTLSQAAISVEFAQLAGDNGPKIWRRGAEHCLTVAWNASGKRCETTARADRSLTPRMFAVEARFVTGTLRYRLGWSPRPGFDAATELPNADKAGKDTPSWRVSREP